MKKETNKGKVKEDGDIGTASRCGSAYAACCLPGGGEKIARALNWWALLVRTGEGGWAT